MTISVGDRIRGHTATGQQVEGAAVRIGATAILLDCGKTVSKASAVLVESPERQQLSIFDALAAPPPELPASEPPAAPPIKPPNPHLIAYLEARIRVYQDFIDKLMNASRQRWEVAQGDAEALEKWKAWAQGVNRWSVQKLIRLQQEARARIERLERGEER